MVSESKVCSDDLRSIEELCGKYFRTKWKRQACLGLEIFAGNSLQRWMQRQPNLLAAAAAAAFRSSEANSVIGPFGSALLNEAKATLGASASNHGFHPASLALHRQM